jgi:hypothetical protein
LNIGLTDLGGIATADETPPGKKNGEYLSNLGSKQKQNNRLQKIFCHNPITCHHMFHH